VVPAPGPEVLVAGRDDAVAAAGPEVPEAGRGDAVEVLGPAVAGAPGMLALGAPVADAAAVAGVPGVLAAEADAEADAGADPGGCEAAVAELGGATPGPLFDATP